MRGFALHQATEILSVLAGAMIFAASASSLAAPMPLKELEFLVRQHHPEAEILREISRRQLAEKPTAQTLDRLVATGASESFIARVQAPEFVAPQRRQPNPTAPTPSAPGSNPAESTIRPQPAPRRGTVGAALVDKIFLEHENQLTEVSPSADAEPQTYLLFFTRAEDKPSRRFMAVMQERLNQWVTNSGARPLEICRALNRTVLARHATGRKALWPIARYEELDPRLQALSAKPETRIALITQDWEILVNEVAPPADLALSKVNAVLKERFKTELR